MRRNRRKHGSQKKKASESDPPMAPRQGDHQIFDFSLQKIARNHHTSQNGGAQNMPNDWIPDTGDAHLASAICNNISNTSISSFAPSETLHCKAHGSI